MYLGGARCASTGADCFSSLGKEKETDRYIPFINTTNDTLEKLGGLNVEGMKEAPKGSNRIIFLVNHPTISQSKVEM